MSCCPPVLTRLSGNTRFLYGLGRMLGLVPVVRKRRRGLEILTNDRNVFEAAKGLQRGGKYVRVLSYF